MTLSIITVEIFGSFVVLALVGLSQLARRKLGPPLIEFNILWLVLLTCIVAIMAVGLLQSHLGCLSLWGDCYSHNYPFWLMDWKPLILWSPIIWSVIGMGVALSNIVFYLRNR